MAEDKMIKQWWLPHPLDKYGQRRLIEIAESANPPHEQPIGSEDWNGNVEMQAKDGWKVVFFYDNGYLDYIDSFIMPDGTRLEVFYDDYQSEDGWPPVMTWKGVGDLEQLQIPDEKNNDQ